jgi:hypothetical protein
MARKPIKKWRVIQIRGKAAHEYGMVQASTADAAIRWIVKEYMIDDPEVLKRLAARPAE